MSIDLSSFGQWYARPSGIGDLMDDLGQALATGRSDLLMLGGGNPALIPEVVATWKRRMETLVADDQALARVLGIYDPPQGNPGFLETLAGFLSQEYGRPVGVENLAITHGAQTAFYYLFNALAGENGNQILFPITPEYIGYAEQGLQGRLFRSALPRIEELDDHTFKYRIDFENLPLDEGTAALCVSRPTNPSGNVLTDGEMERLASLARERGIPLLIDNAYGLPFPGAVFTQAAPHWDEHTILTLSLSKLGLPGTRTGIVVGPPKIIRLVSSLNAVVGLANNNLGQALTQPLFADGTIARLSREIIQPYYRAKAEAASAILRSALPGDLPWTLHSSEGAFFLWLRCRDLPISSQALYQRLKARGVLVVPGESFFYNLPREHRAWRHRKECLRISFAMEDAVVEEGLARLAKEVTNAYRQA